MANCTVQYLVKITADTSDKSILSLINQSINQLPQATNEIFLLKNC